MHSGKVVLVSISGYLPERDDALLSKLVARKIDLFCAVGRDATKWEDALDWLSICEGDHVIVTTSHPDESVEEVIAFAEIFHTDPPHEIEVLYV
jgi:hypothetical protein